MPSWTKEEGKEALGVVSSLKRALGVPNHQFRTDEFLEGKVHIYTPDQESANLIGELLWRYGNGPREKWYNARPDESSLRDTVRVDALLDGGYDASMHINYAPHFAKMMRKMLEKQIAPDKKFTR